MTSTKPAATPATVTITADSLRDLFTALADELLPPEPARNTEAIERYKDERRSRMAGVGAELAMLADALKYPGTFDLCARQVTEMSRRDAAKPVDYEVKEAGA